MTHSLTHEDQRCDGQIPRDDAIEYCQRRDKCQRFIAAKTDESKRMVPWMIPVRNCTKFVEAK